MDMSAIASAVTSLRAAADIAKALATLKSEIEIQSKVIELQQAILAAQSHAVAAHSQLFSLEQENRELQRRLEEAEAWNGTAAQYELTEVAPRVFVYKSRGQQPEHWLCANCFEDKRRSILQLQFESEMGAKYSCHQCKNEIAVPSGRTPGPIRYRDSGIV